MRAMHAFLIGIMFLPVAVGAASGNVTQLKFINDQLTLAPGHTPSSDSDKFTIESQNSGGSLEELDESGTDLELKSSSPTGEFSSSRTTWKALAAGETLTMNKGTSHRSFYYRDSTPGTFQITVSAKDKTWAAAVQSVVIGQAESSSSTNVGTTSGSSGGGSSSSSGGGGYSVAAGSYSAHDSQEELTDYGTRKLSIGAGRKRLVVSGEGVDFHADHNQAAAGGNFIWSFGDGSSATGEKVSHVYKFAGDYNVVLNEELGGEESVARTVVKVLEPKVVIGEHNRLLGYVRLDNKAEKEINVGGWQLANGGNTYTLARDTIIPSAGQVKVPFSASSSGISLRLTDGTEVSSFGSVLGSTTNDLAAGLSARQKLVIRRFLNQQKSGISRSVVYDSENEDEPSDIKASDNQLPLERKSAPKVIELPVRTGIIQRFLGIIGL